MIHCRDAFADLIQILKESSANPLGANPGIIHFFTGTSDEARALLGLGFSFTFGGVITFARNYDELIRLVPLDRLLSETDAPYVAPAPYRGRRNEPAYVVEVVKKLAELKDVSLDGMREQIGKNVRRVFGV
jgi:TatD DNase family protein